MTEQAQGADNLPAPVQRVREIRVVHDDLPMYDTAAFEHLGRVAAIMAQADLLPKTLTCIYEGQGNNRKEIPLPPEVVKARALLIANQARLWNMDPLAVAQCCSLVHNRLMYEGKLVHAVVEAKTGIRLRYEFGLWDTDHFVPVEDESELHKADERLAVRVSGRFDDEDADRTVEGSVGQWKTTGNGSPWTPGAYRRQLRYRGAREWARAHNPGPILGIITDDEAEDFMDSDAPPPRQARVKRDLKARLQAPVEEPREETAPEVEATLETEDGTVIDASTGEVLDDAGADQGPQDNGASDAPTAEEDSGSQASATDASTTSPAPEASGPEEDLAWWQKTEIKDGVAKTGEVYRLASDEAGEDGKVPTYADGVPFSRAGEKGSLSLNVYRQHSPTVPTPSEPEEQDTGEADLPPPDTFLGRVARCDSWLTAKQAYVEETKTEAWNAADQEDRELVKIAIRQHVENLIATGDPVRPENDPTYLLIWMAGEEEEDGAVNVETALADLEKSEKFKKLKPEQQDRVRDQVAERVKSIRGE